MAHLVETMAFVGATPWHGLGNALLAGQSIDTWAKQSGMDWEIREAPVCFQAGSTDRLDTALSFPEHKVLYRSDTHAPLSVVSQRFQVVQPRDILEFYRDLTELSGFALETAGILRGGRKMWALARTGQSTVLKGNDVTRGYVLLATACDGSLATTAQFTSIRVVCNNTLAIALAGNAGAVKVPHSTAFDPQAVKRQLGIAVAAWDAFMDRMKTLSERPVTCNEAASYFSQVFANPDKITSCHANERITSQAMALFEGRGRGAELAATKGTAYGLLNAVTAFVDHERRAKSLDHRLDSAWFGQGARLKQKALDQALLLVA
jgi:phage/plasmid-like protein (TIGR03299 family)